MLTTTDLLSRLSERFRQAVITREEVDLDLCLSDAVNEAATLSGGDAPDDAVLKIAVWNAMLRSGFEAGDDNGKLYQTQYDGAVKQLSQLKREREQQQIKSSAQSFPRGVRKHPRLEV